MISSNLIFVKRFLGQSFSPMTLQRLKENWSSEEEAFAVRQSRDVVSDVDSNTLYDFRIRPEILRQGQFPSLLIWETIRAAKIEYQDPLLEYIYYDVTEFYRSRTLQNNEIFRFLVELPDNLFLYEFDTMILKYPNKVYGTLFNLYEKTQKQNEERITLQELFQILIPELRVIKKSKPKKTIRRRGYKDHGSLGSEFSKTLKEQSKDWSIKANEEERIREKNDTFQFLLGLSGYI